MWRLDDYKNRRRKSSIVKHFHADPFHDVSVPFSFKNRSIPRKRPLRRKNYLDNLDGEKKVVLLPSDEHAGNESKYISHNESCAASV